MTATKPFSRVLNALITPEITMESWGSRCSFTHPDPGFLETFLALGIDELSPAPSLVLPLRTKLKDIGG